MGDILKKKGFISNAERAKNIKKLDRGNGGRKIIISAALISGMALGLFVLLGILGQMHIGGAESALSNLEFIRIDDYADFTASCITWMGWIVFVLLFFTLVAGVLALWFTLTMMSSKDASHRAIKLSRLALPGKKKSGNVAKDVASRVTTTKK